MIARFAVTYDIVTQESSERGDIAEAGFVSKGETLRDAIKLLCSSRTAHCDSGNGLEVSDSWASYYHGMEYCTGAHESRALHWPNTITAASRARVIRAIEKHAR